MLKKKKLMELPVIRGNPVGITAAAEVVDVAGSNILHIDVCDCGELVIRYYADVDADKWISWGEKGGWSQMGLASAVDFEMSRGDYETYSASYARIYRIQGSIDFGDSENRIIEYLGERSYYNVGSAISNWEYSCREERRSMALKRKQERIDALMDRVPDLPEGFREWLGSLFEDFLFVRKDGEKTEYICTACGKKGKRKLKARQGKPCTCPRCGKELKARSLNRKYKPQQAAVVLLQTMEVPRKRRDPLYKILPTKTMWVERQFDVYAYALEGKKDFDIFEDLRAVIPKSEQWGTVYYGEWSDGKLGRQSFWTSNPAQKRWKRSYLFPDNLGEVLGIAGMSHSGLDILARQKVPINVNHFIIDYKNREWIEYLIKAGLYRLVQDLTDNYMEAGLINKSGRTLRECLRLDGAGVCRMKQMNGDAKMLQWLRVERMTGKKISKESAEYFSRHNIGPWTTGVDRMLKFLSPNKLANYLRRQQEVTGETASGVVSTWTDYMDMCKRLKKQTDNEMIYRPKDVRLAHDECLALLKREDAGKRAKEVRKKFPEAEANMQMMTDKYEYESGDYRIIVPQAIEDIIVEGATLGHCIDRTDVYFDRIQNRTSFLVFLRKAERPDAPWYTLEIEPGGTVRQKRTVGNTQRDADVKAFTPFLRQWQKHVLRKMNESDKELAKASREARLNEYADLRARKEPIRRGLLAGKLLVDVLEADLMEAI